MKTFRLLAIASLLAVSAACHKAEPQETAFGSLQVSMEISEQTKAFTEEDLYKSAIVNIYKKDFSGLVRSYPYMEMPSPFYLAVGEYRVDVHAGENVMAEPAKASWENKSYKGSAEFSIIENQTQSVEVVAYVDNAVTAITLDQTVAANFQSGYSLTIGVDPEDPASQLTYTADKSGAEGYFIVSGLIEPSFSWTFSGTLAKDGSAFEKSGKIEGVEAGKLYKMNLKYTIKDGDLSISLVVDESTDI